MFCWSMTYGGTRQHQERDTAPPPILVAPASPFVHCIHQTGRRRADPRLATTTTVCPCPSVLQKSTTDGPKTAAFWLREQSVLCGPHVAHVVPRLDSGLWRRHCRLLPFGARTSDGVPHQHTGLCQGHRAILDDTRSMPTLGQSLARASSLMPIIKSLVFVRSLSHSRCHRKSSPWCLVLLLLLRLRPPTSPSVSEA